MFAVTLICNVPVSTLLSGLETEGCIDVSGIEKDLKSRLVYCMQGEWKYVCILYKVFLLIPKSMYQSKCNDGKIITMC